MYPAVSSLAFFLIFSFYTAQLLDYSTVPQPDCYENQATSLTPCGLCTKPATLLDTATGQVSY